MQRVVNFFVIYDNAFRFLAYNVTHSTFNKVGFSAHDLATFGFFEISQKFVVFSVKFLGFFFDFRNCDVFCMDFQALLHTLKGGEPFDMTFLDPPYALGAVPVALRLLIENGLLADGAKIVCETGKADDVFGQDHSLESCFEIVKQSKYGAAFVTILRACKMKGSENP